MVILRSLTRTAPRAATFKARPFHTSSLYRAYKNDQDRESLDPRPREHTLSGTNDDVVQGSESFDPKKTRPEQNAGTKDPADPLHTSGANQEFNKPQGDEKQVKQCGAGEEISKGGTSKVGSPNKKGTTPLA